MRTPHGSTSRTCDTIHGMLANERRRLVLQYFKDASDHVARWDDLAAYIIKHSADESDEERVRIRLHHVDLPKLDEAGFIEYDPRSKAVRYQLRSSVEETVAEFPQIQSE